MSEGNQYPEEGLFEWAGHGGVPGRCWLQVIPQPDYTVVLVSELGSNPGPSICNGFEELFDSVVKACSLDPARVCWIEHWGPFSYQPPQEREEEYHLTRFRMEGGRARDPRWRVLEREGVEEILGAPLPEFHPLC